MLNKNNLAIEVLYQNLKTLKQEVELLLILTISVKHNYNLIT